MGKTDRIFDILNKTFIDIINTLSNKTNAKYSLISYVAFKDKETMINYCKGMDDICNKSQKKIFDMYHLQNITEDKNGNNRSGAIDRRKPRINC